MQRDVTRDTFKLWQFQMQLFINVALQPFSNATKIQNNIPDESLHQIITLITIQDYPIDIFNLD